MIDRRARRIHRTVQLRGGQRQSQEPDPHDGDGIRVADGYDRLASMPSRYAIKEARHAKPHVGHGLISGTLERLEEAETGRQDGVWASLVAAEDLEQVTGEVNPQPPVVV